MTVKNLIKELLEMPLDAEVQIAFMDQDYNYDYQDIISVIEYEDENTVGLVGNRKEK